MNSLSPRLVVFCVGQIIAVTLFWLLVVEQRDWPIVQQFFGHIGPGIFLVAAGAAALFYRNNLRRLTVLEAWIATIGGALYVLADTLVMHPPFGVFDGAGHAEQEHVSIMAMVFVLGISVLVLLRKMPNSLPTSAYFVIGVVITSTVFLNHHQHTVTGTVGHQTTIAFLAIAALFRVLGKTTEYAIAMIVTGFVFYASQMGFAHYVDTAGNSPGAWFALWTMFGFASATGFLAMTKEDPVPAE